MNLYLVSRNDKEVSWGQYKSYVVAAENEEQAISFTPAVTYWTENNGPVKNSGLFHDFNNPNHMWPVKSKDELDIELIGQTHKEAGVVHTSYLNE